LAEGGLPAAYSLDSETLEFEDGALKVIGGTGGTQYAMAAKLTSFSVTAESKDVVNAEITLVSHGAVTITTIS
jgi:hypothetical protein